ncbi:hybrid sensor histidine kinase/response regulator [Wenzhouxiangella sediminis]|uniref:hybrid sensor histidine kinase/response regulator n=1 Tax=Wenzhouxiangella sediminis TaxID=1792836 RepID=UPI0015F25073|nr:ATP-binding protein [Wenzhouxiangella sediminis]
MSTPLPAQSPTLPLDSDTVRVGIYQNSPKVGLGPSGQPQGIFIDLVEAIAEREGWQLEYVPGTWQQGLDRLTTGSIDLMPDVALTAERAGLFAFHEEPALSSWHQVYAPVGSAIRSILDLDRKRVAVLEGSIQQSQLDNMVSGFGITLDTMPYPDFAAAFEAVRAGRADAVITNRFFGEHNAAKFGLEDTSVIFSPSRLYFAAPLVGRQGLLDAIDRHLVEFKQDPQSPWYRSLERWTSGPPMTTWPDWLPWAAAAVFVMLTGGLVLVLVLRNQVRARTRQVYEQARHHTRELERRVNSRTRELRETSAFFQSLIDHIPSLIYYKDTELRFTGCNRAYERAFGLSRDDIAGKCVTELDYLPRSQREDFELEQRRLLELGGSINREITLDFADGTRHQMLYSAARIQGPEQSPLGIVGLLVDITVQKRVEAELAVARDRAEAADRVKSAFLATMSHELRTPLNSIIGFTGILLQELAGPLNGEQTKQLEMVRNSSQHLLTLINDVLDISRIEAGEMTLAVEAFDVSASVEKVVDIVRPLAERKGISLDVEHRADPGRRLGDARRFEQILFNLIGNAVKFTESGSVDVGIDMAQEGEQNPVIVTIRDSGVGIREEDMRNLFLPFRQIDSTLSRKHEGTGLGLVICKRLTELMNGDIEVSSRWGVGTTFVLRLPLEEARTGEPA